MNEIEVYQCKDLVLYEPYQQELLECTTLVKHYTEEVDSLKETFEELDIKYRGLCPHLVRNYNDAWEDYKAKQPEPDKKQKKRQKKSVKVLWQRLSALTHPDKTKPYSKEIRDQLNNIFISGKVCYDEGNFDGLTLLLLQVQMVHDSGHGEEAQAAINSITEKYRKNPDDTKRKISSMRRTIAAKKQELQDLQESVFYAMMKYDEAGDIHNAILLYTHLTELNVTILRGKSHV